MDSGRTTFLHAAVLVGFFCVGMRLMDLMILEHEDLARRADRQQIRSGTLDGIRGTIYDRRNRELAVNMEAYSLYGVPRRVERPEQLASVLAPLVPADKKQMVRKLSTDREFIWLARKLGSADAQKIRALGLREEIGFKTEIKRSYPKRTLAAHVLGFVNIDNEGKSGVELVYDEDLTGKEERFSMPVDGKRRSLWSGSLEPPKGNNLFLSVDEDLQYLTESELERGLRDSKARSGVAIIMAPRTGEILAMAAWPTYFPDRLEDPDTWRNRAITDMFEPGSTFKAFLAAAALEENAVGENERFDCSAGKIKVAGKWIRDAHKIEGKLTLGEIIRVSSNVGAVEIGQRLGAERYYQYIRAFGFGEKTGVDLPGEIGGALRPVEQWSGLSLASLSLGQEIGVTPLQIATAYCAIANGGMLMRPRVARAVVDEDGAVVKSFEPEPIRRVMSEETSRKLVAMLTGVVEEGGTGELAAVEGNATAGKTGTAQKYDTSLGRYSHEKYVSSFVGFVPADDPRLVVLVVLDEPQGTIYGGATAGPVFRRIAERALVHLDVPRENEGVEVLRVAW